MTYLTVVATFHARPGREDALRDALVALVEPTRKEEGCIQYDVHQDNGAPGRFVFYENWTSGEALDRHLASAHIAALIPRVPELCTGAPEILRCTRIA